MKTGKEDINSVSGPIPTDVAPEIPDTVKIDSTNTPYVVESPLITILYILRYVIPVAYIVLASLVLPLAAGGLYVAPLMTISSGFLVLFIVLIVGNIVLSFLAVENVHPLYCVRTMLIVRYGMIPFFLLNTISASIFAYAGMFSAWVVLWFAIIYWLASSFFFMLPGAFYGIRVIRLSLREKKISSTAAILHGIAQFIPVAGFLDSAYLAVFKWKTAVKISIAILLLLILIIVLILILIPEALPFIKAFPSYVKILFEDGVFGR